MPRAIPPLAARFAQESRGWVDLARVGEVVRVAARSNATVRAELRPARLEALYELAYLRIILSWEVFLEESFLRVICGYSLGASAIAAMAAPYTLRLGPYPTLAAAETAVLAGQPHVSWADPERVIRRSQHFITNGPHELVLLSALAHAAWYADIRNRIAHPSKSARSAFNTATMGLVGRRYAGASPGRFLRDWDTSGTSPRRRLITITEELAGLAGQIAP